MYYNTKKGVEEKTNKNFVVKKSMFNSGASLGSHTFLGLCICSFLLLLNVSCASTKNKSEIVLKNTVSGKIHLLSTAVPAAGNIFSKSKYFLNQKLSINLQFIVHLKHMYEIRYILYYRVKRKDLSTI